MGRTRIAMPALMVAAALAAPSLALGDDAATAAAAPATAAAAPAAVPAAAPATTPTPAPAPTASGAVSAPAFSLVGRSKIATTGTIRLTVTAPVAGKYIAFAEIPALGVDSAVAGAARSNDLFADNGPMPLPYGDATTTAQAGQAVPLIFRAGKAGKAALARIHGATSLRVTIAVMFGPPGGALATKVYVVKLYRTATGASATASRSTTR